MSMPAHACELPPQAKLKFKAFGERYATSAGVAPWNEKWNKYKGKLTRLRCQQVKGSPSTACTPERSQQPACMLCQPAALQTLDPESASTLCPACCASQQLCSP